MRRKAGLGARLDRLARFLRPLTQAANRFKRWKRCISQVPVSELGDPDHRFGFAYNDRNGTGPDPHPALTVDRGSRGHPDYAFLRFASRRGCKSKPVVPGGTAEPARALAKTTRERPAADAGRAAGGAKKAGIGRSSAACGGWNAEPEASNEPPRASTSGSPVSPGCR